MALKGTTVIELTNVKTGEVERYEEHNLITKALEYMHQPIGALKSPAAVTHDGREPVYPSLLGGLVLWDSTIEESDEIITQPHGVKMVGCAAYKQVNTTTSPRRGSYNATESYFTNSSTEKSMKFVYDFATSQANGTIKSVSLTNWKSGWNGFGGNKDANDYQGSRNNYKNCMGHEETTSFWFEASLQRPYGRTFLIDPAEDVFYQVSGLSTSTITIAKRKANIHQKSVFRSQYHIHDLVETFSITLPTTLSGTNTYLCNYDPKTGLLYVIVSPSASSIAGSGTFYVIAVDIITRTATVHTMENPLSSTLYVSAQYMVCHDGYLYYGYYGTSYVRKISLADSTCSSIYTTFSISNSHSFFFLANEMIYFRGERTLNINTYYVVLMLDPVAETVEHTGENDYPDWYGGYCYQPVPIKGHPLNYYYPYTYSTDGVGSSTACVWLNTRYLATINNLSRAIEKTSDKTMKITYTIQEM